MNWFMGAFPFHKASVDETAIPVVAVPVPTAMCPQCGYRSTEFVAFVENLQRQEHLKE